MRTVLACAALFVTAHPALAFDPEWQWVVEGHTPPTFQTKGAAVSHMQSLTSIDPRYALLTVERTITSINSTTEKYRYEVPRVPPNDVPWRYFDSLYGAPSPPGYLWSEADWISDRLGRMPHPPGCPPPTLTPHEPWVVETIGWGQVPTREERSYRRVIYSTSCQESAGTIRAIRDRVLSCPAGYGGEQAAPGCFMNFTAIIAGRRTYSEGCPTDSGARGNPCNAITGDKFETVRDYTGPYGLKFERYYHSRSLDSRNRLGVGWSHNYAARLILSVGGTLAGIIRPDGYRESFTGNTSTGHVSVNGLVVKKISTNVWRAILSDGTIETYNSSGYLTSIKEPLGGVTTLSYTGTQLISVTGPFGHQLQLQYSTDDLLARVIVPGSGTIEFSYAGGNLTSVLYPDSTSRVYHYEDTSFPSHLTGVTDESANRYATFAYDTIGRATLSEHAGAVERYTIAYNATNSVVTDRVLPASVLDYRYQSMAAARRARRSGADVSRATDV